MLRDLDMEDFIMSKIEGIKEVEVSIPEKAKTTESDSKKAAPDDNLSEKLADAGSWPVKSYIKDYLLTGIANKNSAKASNNTTIWGGHIRHHRNEQIKEKPLYDEVFINSLNSPSAFRLEH